MEPKKNPKADLKQWSSIFLLLGLAIMVGVALTALEWKTYDQSNLAGDTMDIGDDLLEEVPITEQLPPPPPPPPPPAPEVIDVVEDEEEVEEQIIESTETNQDEEIVEVEEIDEDTEEEIIEVPFTVIENVPVYPGCEKERGNANRKKCMEEKIRKFVGKKFNSDLANDLGLDGKLRISVLFKIDQHGNVTGVRARAPHPKLEQEAKKVINALPKMTPGMQRGKAVIVSYSLPILFQVEN